MEIASLDSWDLEPIPKELKSFSINHIFSLEDMKLIDKGFIPRSMDDKWFIQKDGDNLNFYRSWTGKYIMSGLFKKSENNFILYSINYLNNNKLSDNDLLETENLILKLINNFLLSPKEDVFELDLVEINPK